MRTSYLAVAALGGALLWSAAAEAAPGTATGSVNLRTGPSTGYARIATIPAGAPVEVLQCSSWCEVIYNGHRGWASRSYIATGYAGYSAPQPVVPYGYYAPRPAYSHYNRPYVTFGFNWNDRDDRRHWRGRDRDRRWDREPRRDRDGERCWLPEGCPER